MPVHHSGFPNHFGYDPELGYQPYAYAYEERYNRRFDQLGKRLLGTVASAAAAALSSVGPALFVGPGIFGSSSKRTREDVEDGSSKRARAADGPPAPPNTPVELDIDEPGMRHGFHHRRGRHHHRHRHHAHGRSGNFTRRVQSVIERSLPPVTSVSTGVVQPALTASKTPFVFSCNVGTASHYTQLFSDMSLGTPSSTPQSVYIDSVYCAYTITSACQAPCYLDYAYCCPRIDQSQSSVQDPGTAFTTGLGATYLNVASSWDYGIRFRDVPNLTINWRVGKTHRLKIEPGEVYRLFLRVPFKKGTKTNTDVTTLQNYAHKFTRSIIFMLRGTPAQSAVTPANVDDNVMTKLNIIYEQRMRARIIQPNGTPRMAFHHTAPAVTDPRGILDPSGNFATMVTQ